MTTSFDSGNYHAGVGHLFLNEGMVSPWADIKDIRLAAAWSLGISAILCIATSYQHLHTRATVVYSQTRLKSLDM